MVKGIPSGGLLLRNSAINFSGLFVPLLAAAACVPRLLAVLGNERFAVLGIGYALAGYFTLLDLGIGRALTQRLARASAVSPEDRREAAELIWTATTLMFVLGGAAGAIFYAAVPALVRNVLRADGALAADCTAALRLLALALPFVVSSSGWRGVFEAYQRFTFISVVRAVMGIATFAGALWMVRYSPTVTAAMTVLALVRTAGWAAHVVVCLGQMPELTKRYRFAGAQVFPLLAGGGWIAVNAMVGSLSLWIDRFLIAALISTSAVVYYATPFDAVTKVALITGAVSNVFFSAFASQHALSRLRATALYRRSTMLTCVVLLPVITGIILLARAGLSTWISPAFAAQSFRLAQVIAIGTFFLAMQAMPWSLLQSTGKAIVPALFDIAGMLRLPRSARPAAHTPPGPTSLRHSKRDAHINLPQWATGSMGHRWVGHLITIKRWALHTSRQSSWRECEHGVIGYWPTRNPGRLSHHAIRLPLAIADRRSAEDRP